METKEIKITGLKKVVSDLKNAQFGAIYLNLITFKLEAVEHVSDNWTPYNVNGGFAHICCVGRYRRHIDGQITIKMLKEIVSDNIPQSSNLIL